MPKLSSISVFFSLLCLVLIFLVFLCSFFFTQSDYGIDIQNRFLAISKQHWFGTDQLGRDFFSLLIVATRNSIIFASIALLVGSVLGTTFAFFMQANFFVYCLEEFNKVLIAMPIILTAILIYTLYDFNGITLLAISLFNIPIFYYLTKNITNRILAKEYCAFSKSIGNSRWNIYRLHIFPQLYNAWLVQFSIQWSIALLMEASLSYLGLGIQQPTPSLGRMLFENRSFYEIRTALVIYPGLVLFILILFFQYFTDSLNSIGEKQL